MHSPKLEPLTAQTAEIIPGQGRILLMDDEEIVREVIAEMLRVIGYTVVQACEGNEALDLYLKGSFDLVILDLINTKGLGGQETMARLAEIDPEVKAVVSSGYCNEPIIQNYAEYGFQGAIRKPYQIAHLSQFISAILTP